MALKIAAVELMIFQRSNSTLKNFSCMGPPLLQTKLRVEESRQQRPIWTQ